MGVLILSQFGVTAWHFADKNPVESGKYNRFKLTSELARGDNMALLVALDECNYALKEIEKFAQLGIRFPEIREAALLLILGLCDQADNNIGDLDMNDLKAQIEAIPFEQWTGWQV